MKGNKLSRFLGKVWLGAKKHSPELLTAGGIGCVVGGFAMAIVSTTKLETVKKKNKKKVKEITDYVEENGFSEEYTEEDYKKDLTSVSIKNGFEYVKLYAPAVIFEATGITSILMSHGILRKRYKGMAVAYTTSIAAFQKYRKKVKELIGEDEEGKLYLGKKTVEIKGTDENGNDYVETKEVTDDPDPIIFSRWTSGIWCPDDNPLTLDTNLTTIKHVEEYITDTFRCKGFLFLNDVLSTLGMKEIPQGQDLGWIYNEELSSGDNFIALRPQIITVKNEFGDYEQAILLDPNCEGDVRPLLAKI